MDLSNLLQGAFGASIIDGISQKFGIENKSARTAIAVGLPLLITALKKNAEKPEGANGILGAISQKHDGSILDNIGQLFGGQEEENDGKKILSHVFGGNESNVVNNISKQSGIDSGKVLGVLAVLAPIVMGLIGKKANEQQTSENGLSGLIGGLLGGNNAENSGSNDLGSLLDKVLDGGSSNESLDELKDLGSKFLGGLFK